MLICIALVVFLLVAIPTTTIGCLLRRVLVEEPARRLSTLTPGKIAFYCALGLAGLLLFWLFETEGVRLFMFMAPDLLVWFTVFDVSVFIDVALISATLTATARVQTIVSSVVCRTREVWWSVVARTSGREGKTRPRMTRGGRPSDEPDPVGWAIAGA